MLSVRQPIVLDVPWLVCVYVSVCLSVSWARPWAVLKWLNRSRCHLGVDTLGPRNHELGGAHILPGEGAVLEDMFFFHCKI